LIGKAHLLHRRLGFHLVEGTDAGPVIKQNRDGHEAGQAGVERAQAAERFGGLPDHERLVAQRVLARRFRVADPPQPRRKLLAPHQVEFPQGAGERPDTFAESQRLVFRRVAIQRPGPKLVPQIVVGQKGIVIPAPVTVHVTHVALAPLPITGIADERAGVVPAPQFLVSAGQQPAEGRPPFAGHRQFVGQQIHHNAGMRSVFLEQGLVPGDDAFIFGRRDLLARRRSGRRAVSAGVKHHPQLVADVEPDL